MKLPNLERRYIDDAKLARYLLDVTHIQGGPKADFLLRFGFEPSDPASLRTCLMRHAEQHDVADVQPHAFGTIYVVRGEMAAPDGRAPRMKTVWQLDASDAPRFVTAHPD